MLLDDEEPHSARVLGDWRDEWWAGDYLRLIAARLELGSHHRALDLGTGLGHWARTVLPLLAEDATMVCIDREPTWTESAAPHERMERATGDVTALPFADESFDLVTGQTILMHVPDARVAVREALRVLRPGGLALFAEPSNLANCLLRDSVSAGYAPARLARMAQLFTHVAEGRRRLGEGDVNWPEVRKALAEIRFSGWATREGRDRSLEDTAQLWARVAAPLPKVPWEWSSSGTWITKIAPGDSVWVVWFIRVMSADSASRATSRRTVTAVPTMVLNGTSGLMPGSRWPSGRPSLTLASANSDVDTDISDLRSPASSITAASNDWASIVDASVVPGAATLHGL